MQALRAAGAEMNPRGWTPLIYAATGGHDDIVKFLLDHGADINAASPNGTTALMMAIHEHQPDTARLLIARGADIQHRNENGATALAWAKRGDETELVRGAASGRRAVTVATAGYRALPPPVDAGDRPAAARARRPPERSARASARVNTSGSSAGSTPTSLRAPLKRCCQ